MEGWTFSHKTRCEFLLWRVFQSLMAELENLKSDHLFFVFSDVKSILSLEILLKSYWSFLLGLFSILGAALYFPQNGSLNDPPAVGLQIAVRCCVFCSKEAAGIWRSSVYVRQTLDRRGNTEVLLLMTRRRWNGFWSTQSGGRAHAVSHPLSH